MGAAIAQLAKHTPGMGEALSPIPGLEKWKSFLRNLESKVLNHGNSQKGLEGAVSKQRNQGRNMVQQVNLLAVKPVPGTQKVEGKNRHIKNQIDLWMFVKIILI